MRSRRLIGLATAVTTLLGGQTLLAVSSAEADPAPAPSTIQGAERALRAAAAGHVTVSRNAAGRVTFVGTAAGRPVHRPAGSPADAAPVTAARAHLDVYGALFGVRDQAHQLHAERVTSLARGRSAVRFQQTAAGLPVLGGELVTVVERDGDLVSVNGETTPSVASARFVVSARSATRAALQGTARRYHIPVSGLSASAPQPWMYDASLVGPSSRTGARAVWRLEVRATDGSPVRQLVLVDAATGGTALSFNQTAYAKERHVCDFNNVAKTGGDNSCGGTYVRNEGDPASMISDVNLAYDYSGLTYDFYADVLGRDSIDNAGMPLISATRYCPTASDCPYENAFWDGTQMTYGDDYANADDVVAHELTHGVTERTSGLLYYYQSGAINESMSDVFGELVDLKYDVATDTDNATVRWQLGEDLPGSAIRDMQDPTVDLGGGDGLQPDRTSSALWDSDWQDAGGVHINSGAGNKAAYLMVDGDTFNGRTVTGIGADKVAHIYYAAQALLTSGSDYRDLYNVLNQACQSLVGGATGITAADCTEVNDATLAVEMNKYPSNDKPIPATPRVCPVGYTVASLLTDNFSGSLATKWSSSGGWTANSDYRNKSTSGPAAFVSDSQDAGINSPSPANGFDRRLMTRNGVSLPRGRAAYLRFEHAYAFDWIGPNNQNVALTYFDGGFVEVSVDGGSWKPLNVTSNGYNHPIEAMNGRRGFGGDSTDWYTSRASLSSFAGRDVKIRFRLRTDGFAAFSAAYGWWVDNVALYSCRGPGAPRSVAVRNISRPRAKMTWAAAVPNPGFSIKNYVVKRSGATARTLPASARSFVWSGLTKGKTYTFTIYSKNNAGAKSTTVIKRLTIH